MGAAAGATAQAALHGATVEAPVRQDSRNPATAHAQCLVDGSSLLVGQAQERRAAVGHDEGHQWLAAVAGSESAGRLAPQAARARALGGGESVSAPLPPTDLPQARRADSAFAQVRAENDSATRAHTAGGAADAAATLRAARTTAATVREPETARTGLAEHTLVGGALEASATTGTSRREHLTPQVKFAQTTDLHQAAAPPAVTTVRTEQPDPRAGFGGQLDVDVPGHAERSAETCPARALPLQPLPLAGPENASAGHMQAPRTSEQRPERDPMGRVYGADAVAGVAQAAAAAGTRATVETSLPQRPMGAAVLGAHVGPLPEGTAHSIGVEECLPAPPVGLSDAGLAHRPAPVGAAEPRRSQQGAQAAAPLPRGGFHVVGTHAGAIPLAAATNRVGADRLSGTANHGITTDFGATRAPHATPEGAPHRVDDVASRPRGAVEFGKSVYAPAQHAEEPLIRDSTAPQQARGIHAAQSAGAVTILPLAGGKQLREHASHQAAVHGVDSAMARGRVQAALRVGSQATHGTLGAAMDSAVQGGGLATAQATTNRAQREGAGALLAPQAATEAQGIRTGTYLPLTVRTGQTTARAGVGDTVQSAATLPAEAPRRAREGHEVQSRHTVGVGNATFGSDNRSAQVTARDHRGLIEAGAMFHPQGGIATDGTTGEGKRSRAEQACTFGRGQAGESEQALVRSAVLPPTGDSYPLHAMYAATADRAPLPSTQRAGDQAYRSMGSRRATMTSLRRPMPSGRMRPRFGR